MFPIGRFSVGMALLGLSACTTVEPAPGTPEFAASQVSRAYDCGLRVDRRSVMARLNRDERPRFLAANQAYAVKAYKAPKRCDSWERSSVLHEIGALTRR
ncbi:hypothetical protein [Bosea sp. PAMC 26642]|uniref:hypothetical protein n=1 Tax=Bosea sp. (strain PAMC 26642) TaxID=1792307 RepID=UPI00076FFFDD|nr:hypothetical protein [Bosea sp. PAMC 26642]AMJ59870.1 hypothetical protein AXW83_05750 [Bosea sp. PAMC 26642]